MEKAVLTKAAAVALATLSAGAAFAQSSVTIYGMLDAGVDNVHKNVGKTALGSVAPASTVTRVSPSLTAQNALGFKGVEDMGGGYKGNFVLEGQFGTDTGAQSGQDYRMWGRQAYVGLTTPVGELRLGRQYAPIFYNFATTTVEAIGATDLMASGLTVNNLQVRQDNQISYWLKAGGLTAAVSYSPNAGVAPRISAVRTPSSTASTGQIIGGLSAGDENDTGRGRTYGLFVNYAFDQGLSLNAGYHHNAFGEAQVGYYPATALGPSYPAGTFIPFYNAASYDGYALGAKYVVPGVGTKIAAIFHRGEFKNDAGSAEGPKVNTLALGVKHPIDQFAIGAEFVYSKFANFTKGKDLGVMLAGDYNFSKRTRVYTRVGFVRDSVGTASATDAPGLNLIGGPLPTLTTLGSTEIPFAAGAGANADATTRFVAVGIAHSF